MLTILSQMLPQFDFSEIRFKIHTEKCTSNVTLPKSVGSDPTPPQEQFWEMRKKSEITHLSPFLKYTKCNRNQEKRMEIGAQIRQIMFRW